MATPAGLFTTEILRASGRLPHRDLPNHIKSAIIAALWSAWRELRRELGDDVPEVGEEDLTAVFARLLNRIREDPSHPSGFTGALFQDVVCDASVVKYDGKSLKQRPDLTFRLKSRHPVGPFSEYRALFVECKIVSEDKGVYLYGKRGLARFVSGKYAWAMPSALMIAYARDSLTIPDSLRGHMEKDLLNANTYRTISLPRRDQTLGEISCQEVFSSKHERCWAYVGAESSPGPITILHIWLPAD